MSQIFTKYGTIYQVNMLVSRQIGHKMQSLPKVALLFNDDFAGDYGYEAACKTLQRLHNTEKIIRLVKKTDAVTTPCRNIAINVNHIALRHLDGQLKLAISDHWFRFSHTNH